MILMSMPLPPPHLEEFRQFSFYPPIRNLTADGWVYQRVTWTEVVARNAATGQELLIPRRFVSDVSLGETSLVLGLTRELEFREGALRPLNSGVIRMPAPNPGPVRPRVRGPAPVVSISLAADAPVRRRKTLPSAVAMGLAVCLAMLGMSRIGILRSSALPEAPRDKAYLALRPTDDTAAVRRALGKPESTSSKWIDGKLFEALHYRSRGYSILLIGAAPEMLRYMGTVDSSGHRLRGF